jgi:hypothetical protein
MSVSRISWVLFGGRAMLIRVLLLSLVLALPSHAQYFHDDFEDGYATDGSPVTWVPTEPYDAGQREVVDAGYVLTPPITANSGSGGEADSHVDGLTVGNASIRSQSRAGSATGVYRYGVGVRFVRDEDYQIETALVSGIESTGRIAIWAHRDGNLLEDFWEGPVTTVIPHEGDVEMQFDVFEDSAALTVWKTGDNKPSQPQLRVDDLPEYVLGEGGIVLWTYTADIANSAPVPTTFHYVDAATILDLLLGDLNLDGEVNGLDVDPFVDVLLNGPYQQEADMNEDQVVNGLDVDPFVATVVGGTQQIPEPSTLLLCIIALFVVGGWRKWGG